MKDLISVIVPVYNVEKYLNRCIESIVQQTYTNLEIILVDDGSPDNCPQICDEWAQKDTRIRVIHQANGGGGKARNVGIDLATGEFITFVDSDDYISTNMYEVLLEKFDEDVDIVECDYQDAYDDNVKFDNISKDERGFSAEDAMHENISDTIFRQLIWNKMYRRGVVEGIKFPIGKKIDDEFWTYQVIGRARKLVRINQILYAYRQQRDSVMHSLDATQRLQAVEAKIQRHRYICDKMPKLIRYSIRDLWFTCIYQGQLTLRTERYDKRKENITILQEILRQYPIRRIQMDISASDKLWLYMASISLKMVCNMRNLLKIGL